MAQLPDPDTEAVKLWLKSVDRSLLAQEGWIQVNRQFHGIAMAMRPFLQKQFPDPAQQAAAFDGLVAGLMTLGHFDDIQNLSGLLQAETPAHAEPSQAAQTLPAE